MYSCASVPSLIASLSVQFICFFSSFSLTLIDSLDTLVVRIHVSVQSVGLCVVYCNVNAYVEINH